MEKWDQLWPDGPRFVFSEAAFLPSTDSFLLGAFPKVRRGDRVCDLGAGMGLLGLLLWARQPDIHLTAVELQAAACDLCRRNYAENGIDGAVLQADLREVSQMPAAGSCDIVICNPPYFTPGSGFVAAEGRGIARSEMSATLKDVCVAASRLLPTGGRFAIVYRPERLIDLLVTARQAQLEPKRLRSVQTAAESEPSLVLLECRKGGHPGLKAEAPILLRNAGGTESADVRRAYFRDKEN